MKRKILITGATGVVGSEVAPLFINDPENNVFLLMRANNSDALLERKRDLEKYWGEDLKSKNFQVLAGDVTLRQLGLNNDIYAGLKEGLTHIVHCAANVSLDMPLDESLYQTLGGLKNILELQKGNRHCKLEYVSTVGVNGRNDSSLKEENLASLPEHYFNTYEQAKAQSEQLLYQWQADGYPITIHRPSMVVGHSLTGKIIHFQVFYFLLRLISGSMSFGVLPNLKKARLDTVPSDLVARILIWSAYNKESHGKVYHHSSGWENSISIPLLQTKVRTHLAQHNMPAPRLWKIPVELFKVFSALEHLPGLSESWKLRLKLLPQFLGYASKSQNFVSTETRKVMAKEGVHWPEPSEYLDKVILFYVEAVQRKRSARTR